MFETTISSLQGRVFMEHEYNGNGYIKLMPFPGLISTVAYAVCDWDSDGFTDIIFGAGPGGAPHVKVYQRNEFGVLGEVLGKFVSRCDATFCYTGGIVGLQCLGNRKIRVKFGNNVVQDHDL